MAARSAPRPSSGVAPKSSLSSSLNSLFQKTIPLAARPPITSPRLPTPRAPQTERSGLAKDGPGHIPQRSNSQPFRRHTSLNGLFSPTNPARPQSARDAEVPGGQQAPPRPTPARPPTAPTSLGFSFSLTGVAGLGIGSSGVPSTAHSGAVGAQAFHKGIVSALGGVLKQNRRKPPADHDEPTDTFSLPPFASPQPRAATASAISPRGSDRDRREMLVSQKRNEWAQQRWSATTREQRRTREKDFKLRQTTPDAGEIGLAIPTPSVETAESTNRKVIEGLEDESFGVILKCTSMMRGRQAIRSSSPVSVEGRPLTANGTAARIRRDQLSTLEQLRQEGNTMYQRKAFTAAHAAYSRVIDGALSYSSISSPADREAIRQLHALALLNRAATSLSLINYDSCVADGMDVIRITTPAPGDTSSTISADPITVKAWLRVAKAYVLTESYKSAEEAYGHAFALCQKKQNPKDEVLAGLESRAATERRAIAPLQRARSACLTENFKEALNIINQKEVTSSGELIGDFRMEAPIILAALNAEVHISPGTARLEGAKYLSALIAIAEQCEVRVGKKEDSAGTTGPPNTLLMSNFVRHLCDTLALVAKAAYYSGQLYLNIANQKLSMCLALRHDHRAALSLKKQIDHFERQTALASSQIAKGNTGSALDVLTALLAISSKQSGALTASVALARADLFVTLNNIPSAVSDATLAIDSDNSNPRAYAVRSRLFQSMGNFSNALRDLSMAATLSGKEGPDNPYFDDLEALRDLHRADTTAYSDLHSRCNSARPRTSNSGDKPNRASGSRVSSARVNTRNGAYNKLGLAPGASVTDVKNAYKRLALLCHPDKLVDAPAEVQEQRLAAFKEISKAYSEIMEGAGLVPPA